MSIPVYDLPAIRGWKDGAFDPIRPARSNQMRGRRTERLLQGAPYWIASYQTVHVTYEDFGLMDAFRMQMDGGGVFRAYDPMRARPIAHDKHDGKPLSGTKASGGAFNGQAALVEIISATKVRVGGLPAGFQMSVGDYLSFIMATLVVSLHRVTVAAAADSSGVVTLDILHPLDTQHFTTASVVHFEKPFCLMQVDPASWGMGKPVSGERPVSFSAQEVFFYGS